MYKVNCSAICGYKAYKDFIISDVLIFVNRNGSKIKLTTKS